MHPLVNLHLGNAKTPAETQKVWKDHWDQLEGYTFVLSHSGTGPLRFPAKLDLPGGAFLRSVFAHDHLYFISHQILGNTIQAGKMDLPVDYSVSFDSNTASYIRALANGRRAPIVDALRACMRGLGARRLNWDYFPYLMERAESLLQGRDLGFIYETVAAAERFAACDITHFEATGELRTPLDDAEISNRAQQQLAGWHRTLRGGVEKEIPHRLSLFYAATLKAALIHLQSPGIRLMSHKMDEFLDFLEEQLHCMPMLIAAAAFEFFSRGSDFEPFAKLASWGGDMRSKAKNVAWDFYHVQQRQQFANYHGRNGSFLLPFFLTFDQGLAALFDACPQRSCLLGKDLRLPLFYADFDFVSQTLQKAPELGHVLAKHFTIDAHGERTNRLQTSPPDMAPLIAQLEAELEKGPS